MKHVKRILIVAIFGVVFKGDLFSQSVGIGSSSFTPGSMLSVDGSLSVGNSYRSTSGPSNGMIVEGNVGIGSNSPSSTLDIASTVNTGNAFKLTANNITTGSALNITSTGAIASPGTLASLTANSATSGTLLKITGNALTSGEALNISSSNNFTGTLTSITGNATTVGELLTLSANALTTGAALDVQSSSTSINTGALVKITSSGAIGNTNGSVLNVTSTGANTNGYLTTIIGNSVAAGGLLNVSTSSNASTGTIFRAASTGTSTGTVAMISNAGSGYGLRVNDDGTDTDASPFIVNSTGNVGISTTTVNNQLSIGGTTVSIGLDGTTSNMLIHAATAGAAPAFTTRSVGTKIVLYPSLTAADADYGIGIEGSAIWFSVPRNTNTYSYKWYGGTTERMRLQGDGNLGIGSSTPAQKLDVAGTIVGALPLVAYSFNNDDKDNGDDQYVGMMAASVPSTNHVWARFTTSKNVAMASMDATGSYSAWTDFDTPTGASGNPYIISLSCTIMITRDDNDDVAATLVARMSDGTCYLRSTTAGTTNASNLTDTANWSAWTSFNSPGM